MAVEVKFENYRTKSNFPEIMNNPFQVDYSHKFHLFIQTNP